MCLQERVLREDMSQANLCQILAAVIVASHLRDWHVEHVHAVRYDAATCTLSTASERAHFGCVEKLQLARQEGLSPRTPFEAVLQLAEHTLAGVAAHHERNVAHGCALAPLPRHHLFFLFGGQELLAFCSCLAWALLCKIHCATLIESLPAPNS